MLSNLRRCKISSFRITRCQFEDTIYYSLSFNDVFAGMEAINLNVKFVFVQLHSFKFSSFNDYPFGGCSLRFVEILISLVGLKSRVNIKIGNSLYWNKSKNYSFRLFTYPISKEILLFTSLFDASNLESTNLTELLLLLRSSIPTFSPANSSIVLTFDSVACIW